MDEEGDGTVELVEDALHSIALRVIEHLEDLRKDKDCPYPSPPRGSRQQQTERDAASLASRLLYAFVKRSMTSRGGG